MPPKEASAETKKGVPMLLAVLLGVVGLGLGIQAVRSVLLTGSGEVVREPQARVSRIGPDPGEIAPPFAVPALMGRGRVDLTAFRGHPVVLNFWASWCPPCRAEAPVLTAAYRAFRGQGVVFIGIDVEQDLPAAAVGFVHQHALPYVIARDNSGKVALAYHVTGLPTTYFIDAGGRVLRPASTGGFLGNGGARDLTREIQRILH